ncbi:Tigger transposable element-derived protein 4 [Araneus ventricosus]|uniref:Tigger transposable element-derived protein 4 n=1 Tax=Araneus ventricosus TaxID=182803 RepID=A0A4Y2BSM8_ARAVE|nr:Tigger transposable element-derived protein 4 [Araneus ventricosus]
MSGEIEKLLAIGKAAKPRCFKNLDVQKLPVIWKSNKKAWMTAAIMEECLKTLTAKMKKERSDILLFLDNATCHPHIELSNIQLAWFTPNTTSVTQPMDQGFIRCVKVNYRKFLMQSLLANMKTASNASDIIKSVTVLDAVMWLPKARKEISKQTIQKCFLEANFSANNCIEKHSSTEDIDARDLQILLNNGNFSDMSAKELISIDDDILTEVPIGNENDIIPVEKYRKIYITFPA